jgi:hypothetical protein
VVVARRLVHAHVFAVLELQRVPHRFVAGRVVVTNNADLRVRKSQYRRRTQVGTGSREDIQHTSR